MMECRRRRHRARRTLTLVAAACVVALCAAPDRVAGQAASAALHETASHGEVATYPAEFCTPFRVPVIDGFDVDVQVGQLTHADGTIVGCVAIPSGPFESDDHARAFVNEMASRFGARVGAVSDVRWGRGEGLIASIHSAGEAGGFPQSTLALVFDKYMAVFVVEPPRTAALECCRELFEQLEAGVYVAPAADATGFDGTERLRVELPKDTYPAAVGAIRSWIILRDDVTYQLAIVEDVPIRLDLVVLTPRLTLAMHTLIASVDDAYVVGFGAEPTLPYRCGESNGLPWCGAAGCRGNDDVTTCNLLSVGWDGERSWGVLLSTPEDHLEDAQRVFLRVLASIRRR